MEHHGAIKQILWYLVGTKNLGITYSRSQDVNETKNLFHGYADATFVNADDHKSMMGYVFLATGGATMWKSKKQTVIALSSTEAGCEAIWLRNLYGELGFPQEFPTPIQGNNKGSVILTHNPQSH